MRQKLGYLESQTWNKITIKGKKQNHSIPVEDLCRAAQEGLLAVKQNDVAELVSLHLSGKERVWGIRDKYIFKILWWDPDHLVCPSLKKCT